MSDIKPYPFQNKVAENILYRKNIILQAPTGAGKTRAALIPFIQAWRKETPGLQFPTKCVYCVPMRVLANQFVIEFKDLAQNYSASFHQNLTVEIQTGEQSNDPRFESELVFCTIDQFLSSYLTLPYSLPKRLSNINAGAFIGSYLIFDEVHLLDPKSTLPTTLFAIKQLSKVAPVLLMTATFSEITLNALAKYLNADVITVDKDETLQIETKNNSQKPKTRRWFTENQPLNIQNVLTKHSVRSLVLCNTVKKAREFFRELKSAISDKKLDIEVILLHSQFLDQDRKRIEDYLRKEFGKNSNKLGSIIAIATQTIEVGVDITCQNLHTELAPASALIQRAGRCARYPGEDGNIYVYNVEKYFPYGAQKLWEEEMIMAWEWLEKHCGEIFDFQKEQEFVNAVATPRDEQIIQGLIFGEQTRKEKIYQALQNIRPENFTNELIRDADSRKLLIHHSPDVLKSNPYAASGFSLQTGTLAGLYKKWREMAGELGLEWFLKGLIEEPLPKNTDKDSNKTEYEWKNIVNEKLIPMFKILVVHSALAGYLSDEGFVPDIGDTAFVSEIPENSQKKTWEGFSYNLESYETHIRLVLENFEERVLPELKYPALALEKAAIKAGCDWKPNSVILAAWLACLLHDVGKLSQGWQLWAHAYQDAIKMPLNKNFSVAHTEWDFHNQLQKEWARKVNQKYPKPHHAGESAIATSSVISTIIGKNALAQALVSAIMRHHTPFAEECQPFSLRTNATQDVINTLKLIPVELQNLINTSLIKNELKTDIKVPIIEPQNTFGWMAYCLLVRALRRADQLGTAEGGKKLKI